MKLFHSILSSTLVAVTVAVPALKAAESSQQPASFYPIGISGGQNAKVAGRLFDIDGRVERFAGKL
jgi:mannan endo-1,4-beta-mannosidase